MVVKALGLVNDHSTIDDIDRRYLTFSGHIVTHYFLFSTQIRTYRDVHECCRVFSGFSLFMSGCLAAHIRYYFILSKLRGRSTYSSLFSTIVIFSALLLSFEPCISLSFLSYDLDCLDLLGFDYICIFL